MLRNDCSTCFYFKRCLSWRSLLIGSSNGSLLSGTICRVTRKDLLLTVISFAMGWTSVIRQPLQMLIDLLMMKI